MKRPSCNSQHGFTLIELLTAMGIFLLVCGAAFSLLTSSQQRYQTESQVLNSFQEGRLGLDQIVRDVNDAGFPPPVFNNGIPTLYAITPFAWSPGYTAAPCTPSVSCATPGDFDLIIETNDNPNDPNCAPACNVQWIRYQLQGTVLYRSRVDKTAGNPAAATATQLAPFVQNVVNNAPTAQDLAAYPGMFPGGNPVPIFSYVCFNGSTPVACATPRDIQDVVVTLIVAAPLPDATTGQPRLVKLKGRGRRINPNQ